MNQSQWAGLLAMICSLGAIIFTLYGAARRSYLAVALPVMAVVALISALAFWIGWTLFTSSVELEELEEAPSV